MASNIQPDLQEQTLSESVKKMAPIIVAVVVITINGLVLLGGVFIYCLHLFKTKIQEEDSSEERRKPKFGKHDTNKSTAGTKPTATDSHFPFNLMRSKRGFKASHVPERSLSDLTTHKHMEEGAGGPMMRQVQENGHKSDWFEFQEQMKRVESTGRAAEISKSIKAAELPIRYSQPQYKPTRGSHVTRTPITE